MYKICLIIFGPPGVGKGTQAALISEKYNLFHFSTGEALRNANEDGTELGIKAHRLMEKGELVPDEIMIGIVEQALKANQKENGFVLDGFPRTIEQAEALVKIFEALHIENIIVLTLEVNKEEIVRRLMNRGRSDDKVDSIKNRLIVYQLTTEPVLNFLKGRYNVIQTNGVGTIEGINSEINSQLVNLINN